MTIPDSTLKFSSWAEDEFGKDHGDKLLQALFHVERIQKFAVNGNYEWARIGILNIAMLFPDVADQPAFSTRKEAETARPK